LKFVGDWEAFEQLVDADGLPKDVRMFPQKFVFELSVDADGQ
jgi:hypothetical protein